MEGAPPNLAAAAGETPDAGPKEARREVSAPPERVIAALAEAAEAWGGSFDRDRAGGALVLPIQAGLRHGRWQGRAICEPATEGSRLRLQAERVDYALHRPAVAFLGLSAGAGLVLALWPFFPGLTPLLPLALLVAVGGWFLVVARIQNRGLEEFLDLVTALVRDAAV